MKIYLARHGQTTGDVEDRFGGDFEDHLTERGRKQACMLAGKLRNEGIEKIFVSPRIRAQETATIIKEEVNVSMETVEEIRERNHYGVMTGMIKSEAKEKYPHLIELLGNTKNTITGGEDYESFKGRVVKAWNNILKNNYNTVAIISHGGPIRLIFREILAKGEINIDDCAYAVIEVENGRPKLLSMEGISYKSN